VRRGGPGASPARPTGWHPGCVRLSEFWRLMDDELGAAYARSVASTQVVGALDGRTPDQALEAGTPPREVWAAVCDAMDVPPERRLGRDEPARRR